MGDFPDILEAGLDVIFIGFNPGLRSGETGHHYAGRNNRFWDLLFESGLTPGRLTPERDRDLLRHGLGSTNLVRRATPGSGDLSRQELQAGAREILERVTDLGPRAVCYLGKGVYRAALAAAGDPRPANAPVNYGPCPVRLLPGIIEFVAPNPSGRSALPWPVKLEWFRRLAEQVRPVSGRLEPTAGRAGRDGDEHENGGRSDGTAPATPVAGCRRHHP